MMKRRISAEEIDIGNYWDVTKYGWRIWVGAGLIAMFSAGAWSYCVQPTQYRAAASIVAAGEIAPSSAGTVGVVARIAMGMPAEVGSEAELCGYILQTRATQRAVVEACDLQKALSAGSPAGARKELRRRTRIELERPNIARLEVVLPGRPRAVELMFRGSREATAELVRRTVDRYIVTLDERLGALQLSGAKRKRIFLHEQRQQVEIDLNAAEQQLQQWEAEHEVVEIDSTGQLAVQTLMALEEQQEQARVELKAAQQHVGGLRDKLKEQPEVEAAAVVHRANPLVDEIREKLVALESRLAVAREAEGKSAQHPEVRKLQRELEAGREALAEEQQRAMVKASSTEVANPVARKLREELALEEARITGTRARIEGLGEALRRGEQQMADLSEETLEYSRLARRVKIKQEVFETLATEYERALIEEQSQEPVFRVIDEPVAPKQPAAPDVVANMGLAGGIGVLVGWMWIMAGGLAGKGEEGRGEGSD